MLYKCYSNHQLEYMSIDFSRGRVLDTTWRPRGLEEKSSKFDSIKIFIVDRGHGRLETKVTSSIIVFSRDNYPLLLLPQSIVLSS